MAEATDQQMQTFCDVRIRPRAEQGRSFINSLRDDKAEIDDVYNRANGSTPWNDARTDGPPKLLHGQDVLVYNAVASLLLKCIDGTATSDDVSALHSNWTTFQQACVRPVSQG